METKAISGPDGPWSRRREAALALLLEDTGAERGLENEPLNAAPANFDAGMELVRGEREPNGQVEADALARFKRLA